VDTGAKIFVGLVKVIGSAKAWDTIENTIGSAL
jgi:hypothetical protein